MITLVGNLKGGTGKSTVAFNLSIWLATNHNVHVAVYDLDPQATISDSFEIRQEDGHLPAIYPSRDVDSLGSEGTHTEVIVDVGLSDKAAMQTAIRKADRIVVPIAPSQADIWSTQRFLKMIGDAVGETMPEVIGFMNRSDTHSSVRDTDDAYEALQGLPGIKMIDVRLYQRTAYRRAFSEGLAVFELDRKSKAAEEINTLGRVLF